MAVRSFEEELAASGTLVYTNVGVSMLPLLREGRDVMVLQSLPRWNRPLRPGDAVLFRRPGVRGRGAYVLHRILRVLPDHRFWIVGDNCTDGETVEERNILGVLTAVSRDGGKPVPVTDWRCRLYVRLWCRPWPLRFVILRAVRFVRRYAGALRRRLRGGERR